MKKVFLIMLTGLVLVSCKPGNADKAATGEAGVAASAEGQKYYVSSETAMLNWRGTKPTGEHTGTIALKSGEISVSNNTVTGGSFVVDMNSIVCSDLTDADMNGKLVGHLKSEDFFHVAEFPEAKFEIVSIESLAEGAGSTHKVTGNLSVRGTTKSISFPADISMEGSSVMVEAKEFSIDRTLWNVNFMSKSVMAELKDNFIDYAINLKFNMNFSK